MPTVNDLNPRNLASQGDKVVSEGQRLLNTASGSRWGNLWPSRRQPAQDLLTHANDYRESLSGKCMRGLKQIVPARRHANNAKKTLLRIKDRLSP